MKILLSFLSLMIIPTFCLADACTDPENYTIDKRCYVTEEQKQEKPYNAVVGLFSDIIFDDITCTGTIVRRDNKLYLYTAKHCTDSDKQYIKLQTGKKLKTYKYEVGNFDKRMYSFDDVQNDWAIYEIKEETKYIPSVNITEYKNTSYEQQWRDVALIGYGSLKIMSDKEFREFKEYYKKYLEKKGLKNGDYSMIQNKPKMRDIFNDKSLKVSFCKYSSAGYVNDCQAWKGNSGGGLFDKYGNLMGIASMGLEDDFKLVGAVNLQQEETENIKKFINDISE